MINMEDLRNMQPGKITFIRARRPAWGSVDLHKHIFKLGL